MAGYRPKTKIYRIEPGGEYEGLVVRVRSVPVGQFMALADLADGIDAESIAGTSLDEAAAKFGQIGQLFEALADALIEWNVEDDDGQPVPATLEGLYRQDFDLVMFLVGEWIGAMGGISGPLEQKPTGSAPSNVPESLGLAGLSTPLSDVPS